MGILIVCFWGVIFPLISEIFTGQKVTVGPPFYERATGPLWAGLLLLMGVAPLSVYGRDVVEQPGTGGVEAGRRLAARAGGGGGRSACAMWRPLLGLLAGGPGGGRGRLRILARGSGAPQAARGEPAPGAGPAGRAQPAALRRLHHPPGRGGHGPRHHRHRDLPDGDPGHAGAGRADRRWAAT